MTVESENPPRFHVIVVLYNSAQWVESCLAALQVQSLPPARITVLDNASSDNGFERAERFPGVHAMRSPINLGFAGGNNRAAQTVRDCDFVLLLNPDTVLAMNALEELAKAFATHTQIGVLGMKVLNADVETIQHVGVKMRGNGLTDHVGGGESDDGQYTGVLEARSVLGAAMAVRQAVWTELGGLDERFYPAYYEETDFCLRAARNGWGVGVCCEAVVTHFDSSAGKRADPAFLEMFFRSRALFLKKHYGVKLWLTRYLPDEFKWLTYWGSKGMRRIALKTMLNVWLGKKPSIGKMKSPY